MIALRTTSPKNSQGFTLVEVLMAMLIMTVGLLGLLQSVTVAYEHNLGNRLREEAVLIGEEKMNDLRRNNLLGSCTVPRVIGGAIKNFTVTTDSRPIGGDSCQLTVVVSWVFKNQSPTHTIYTLKRM